MRAGQLDRRITLRQRVTTRGSLGEEVEGTPTDLATVWARWRPLKGTERFTAQQLVDTAAGEFDIRYRSDITIEDVHEVLFDGDVYDVMGVPEEIGRREGWRLQVSRRVQ